MRSLLHALTTVGCLFPLGSSSAATQPPFSSSKLPPCMYLVGHHQPEVQDPVTRGDHFTHGQLEETPASPRIRVDTSTGRACRSRKWLPTSATMSRARRGRQLRLAPDHRLTVGIPNVDAFEGTLEGGHLLIRLASGIVGLEQRHPIPKDGHALALTSRRAGDSFHLCQTPCSPE